MRDIANLVEIRSCFRDFDAAHVAAFAEERVAAGIVCPEAVNKEVIVVVAGHDGGSGQSPGAIRLLDHIHLRRLAASTSDENLYFFRIRGVDPELHAALGINAGILGLWNVG